jgi:Transglutaminase-like enzymes, putative cysteine proteases
MRSSLIDKRYQSQKQNHARLDHGGNALDAMDQPTALPPLHQSRPISAHPQRSSFWRCATPREGWLALCLLALALYCVVYAIVAAHWVDDGNALYYGPVLGLLGGLVVAKAPRISQVLLHLFACVVGYLFSLWVACTLVFHSPLLLLFSYLIAAFTGHLSAQPLEAGQMVFFFYLAFLCFFLGYFGSWLIYRAQLPWLVAFVYCAIMLVDLNYVSVSKSYLNYYVAIMLSALLLLIARVHLAAQVARWVENGLYVDRTWLHKITTRCMRAACLITVCALPLSLLLPIMAQPSSGKVFWSHLDQTWTSLLNGRLSLNDLRTLAMDNGTNATSDYFGDSLQVSSSINLLNGDVLSYQSSDDKGHYLESIGYDHFDGHTWSLSPSRSTTLYQRDERLSQNVQDTSSDPASIFTSVHLLSTINGSSHFLFIPSVPAQFDVPANVVYLQADTTQDALAWSTPLALQRNSTYSVISLLPMSDTSALATVPLPADDAKFWSTDASALLAKQSYLQVPTDLSPNVRQILLQWTQGANNTYQALRQIEAHLSDPANFTYSTTNPAIPDNVDVVDWLLQTRSGYCTYYATAMVIMARLLHIPTRLMSGFSAGTYNATDKLWVVQGSDAHSWVQAYFPGYGWINFDPTPGYSGQAGSAALPAPTPNAAPAQPTVAPTTAATPRKRATQPAQPAARTGLATSTAIFSATYLLGGTGILVCVLALLGVVLWFSRRRPRRAVSPSDLYLRIGRLAAWVGLGPRRWQTPYEYSEMLSHRMAQHDPVLWRLTELFVRERWGSSTSAATAKDSELLAHGWSRLRLTMIRRILLRRRARTTR